jgi:hypothetical protein
MIIIKIPSNQNHKRIRCCIILKFSPRWGQCFVKRLSCTRHTQRCFHEALPLKATGKSIPRTSQGLPRAAKSWSLQRWGKRSALAGGCQWLLPCEQSWCGDHTWMCVTEGGRSSACGSYREKGWLGTSSGGRDALPNILREWTNVPSERREGKLPLGSSNCSIREDNIKMERKFDVMCCKALNWRRTEFSGV